MSGGRMGTLNFSIETIIPFVIGILILSFHKILARFVFNINQKIFKLKRNLRVYELTYFFGALIILILGFLSLFNILIFKR